ncbi:MAG: hypothetical protein QOG30_1062, partial [Acidimicrobiaceae bacterium]
HFSPVRVPVQGPITSTSEFVKVTSLL